MREIALDTETTGLDPDTGHRIVEIGCVEMVGRIRTGRHFHAYLNPDRDMPEDAERVHGLSHAFLLDKPRFREEVDALLDFIGDAPLVIHNAEFDMKFLNWELQHCGRSMLPMHRAVDTVMMARRKYPGAQASLDALCRRYDIDLSARTLHGALLDAELLADVYLELTGGRQASMELAAESTIVATSIGEQIVIRPARHFTVPAAELAAHAEFLKQLKDPVWLRHPTNP